MKIRDRFAGISDDSVVLNFENGIQIVADDGRTLFDIHLNGGCLVVNGGDDCVFEGKNLEGRLFMKPHSSNQITVFKPEKRKPTQI